MAISVRRLSSGYWHIRGVGPCNYAQPPIEERLLSNERAACLSGADALVRVGQTCGNCKHAETVTEGTQSMLLCKNDDALGSFKDRDWSVDPDDGCIKGWATREAE